MAESQNDNPNQGSEINKSKHFMVAKAQFETSIKTTDWQGQNLRRTLEFIQ
jgi:hypothetical protein